MTPQAASGSLLIENAIGPCPMAAPISQWSVDWSLNTALKSEGSAIVDVNLDHRRWSAMVPLRVALFSLPMWKCSRRGLAFWVAAFLAKACQARGAEGIGHVREARQGTVGRCGISSALLMASSLFCLSILRMRQRLP